jgi:signal transduction histidine kinase
LLVGVLGALDLTSVSGRHTKSSVIAGLFLVSAFLLVLSSRRVWSPRKASHDVRPASAELESMAAIVDAPSVFTAIIDREGSIVRCNTPFRDLLGASLLQLDPRPAGVDRLLAFASGGEDPLTEIDIEMMTPGTSQVRKVHCTVARTALPDVGSCVVVIGQDETKRLQAQKALATTARLLHLSEVTTSIAHELSQPLNAIGMAARNALDEVETSFPAASNGDAAGAANSGFRDYAIGKFQRIAAQVDRAALILARMRILGRNSSGKDGTCDARDICRNAINLVANHHSLDGITINRFIPDQPMLAVAPQILIEQAVVHLLSNACESLSGSGQTDKRITVSVRQGRGCIVIRVADNGPGVAASAKDRIFQPFFTTKPNPHVGLGLSLAFGSIHDAGGKLSLLEGPGTAFEIELPVPERA